MTTNMTETGYKIALLGCSLDTGNKGVSALAASVTKIMHTLRSDTSFHLLIGNRSAGRQEVYVNGKPVALHVVNYRLSPRSRLHEHLFFIVLLALMYRLVPVRKIRSRILKKNRWLRTVSDADFIGDIYGGDSFSDIYGLGRFLLSVLPRVTILLLHKRIIFLPQTYGPYKSLPARIAARVLLKGSPCILARDFKGAETVRGLFRNGSHPGVQFCPDVAFVLDSRVPEKLSIDPEIKPSPGRLLVGFNINALLFHGGYSRKNMFDLAFSYREFVDSFIRSVLKMPEVELLLIPHNFGVHGSINNDLDVCRKVFGSMSSEFPEKLHTVTMEYDQHGIKGIIGLCDFFIGSRMHSCIAAISSGVPTIGLAYSRKFIGVFESIGLTDNVIDARAVSLEQTVEKTLQGVGSIKKNRKADRIEKNIEKSIMTTFNTLMAGA
jgi:polysaccharide pyruvyl transferase WcaK-like protein